MMDLSSFLSKEYHSEFIGLDFLFLHHPVVQIVVEDAIACLKMKIFEGCWVVHQVETVIDIETLLFSQNKGISNQIIVGDCCGVVIKGIAGLFLT